MGACLFTDIGIDFHDKDADSRIIAYIISGIGILGGGIILKEKDNSGAQGLRTAATVWCTAGVGVAKGMEFFITAVPGSLAIYFLLSLHRWKWYQRLNQNARKRSDVGNSQQK